MFANYNCYNASMLSHGILSYDEYAHIESVGFPLPYVIESGQNSHNLLFYGSKHDNNPTNPEFADIEARWNAFITRATNPIALVEGHFDEVSVEETTDKVQSITAGGESQFVVHLARRDGISVKSPEPDRVWEANELAKEFGRENVILFYFVRQLSLWSRFTEKPNIDTEAVKMLDLMRGTFNWQDVDFTTEGMQVLHERVFHKRLAMSDPSWLYNLTTPATHEFVTNEVARKSGDLRDSYLLDRIRDLWQKRMSPFVVFGASHAIRLEPAISRLVSS